MKNQHEWERAYAREEYADSEVQEQEDRLTDNDFRCQAMEEEKVVPGAVRVTSRDDYACVLLELTATSNAHQRATGIFWGTCLECDKERKRLRHECANKLDLRVSSVKNAHYYTF